jgi:hypothetical protein
MPETFQELPDGKRLVVFETNQHPDISGTVNIQATLKADIPTYQISVEGVTLTSGKNLITVFNNLPTKRIRVQNVYAYARTSANNAVTLSLGYINSGPTDGTSGVNFAAFAVDFANNPAPPNNIQYRTANTSPQPISGVVLGGNRISLSTPNQYEIFSADRARNGSALQLRPTQDGITVKQVDGGTTGTLNCHVIFTLD